MRNLNLTKFNISVLISFFSILFIAIGSSHANTLVPRLTIPEKTVLPEGKVKAIILGKVIEDANNRPLTLATIQLLQLPDSTFISGVTTNTEGAFSLNNIAVGKYLVRCSYIGMQMHEEFIEVFEKKPRVNLQTIKMFPDEYMIDELIVTAEAPEVMVVEDTLVYAASAYKTPPGAMVEELIKKLPGAEIDQEGNIVINGKPIKKILVDGKEFFLNDPKVALKNLPVDMIEKIRTYDKSSDMAKASGIDDGDEETVLDLSIKPDMKKGWLGKVNAGTGTFNRYAINGMVNRFKGDDHMTIFYNRNNTNDMGFGGGYSQWRIKQGQNEKQQVGLDFMRDRKKVQINGSVSWDRNDRIKNLDALNEIYNATTNYSSSVNRDFNHDNNFSASFKINWTVDSLTTVLIRPNMKISKGRGTQRFKSISSYGALVDNQFGNLEQFTDIDSLKVVEDADISALDLINQQYGGNHVEKDNYRSSLSAQINHKWANNKYRSLTFSMDGNLGSSNSTNWSGRHVYYYKRTDTKRSDRFQRLENENNNYGYRLRMSYNEPITEHHFLQFSYSYYFKHNKQERATYMPTAEQLALYNDESYMMVPMDSLSIDRSKFILNDYYNQDFRFAYKYKADVLRYSIGFTGSSQKSVTSYDIGGIDYDAPQHVWNYSPTFDLKYRFSKRSALRIKYRGRTSQPNILSLIPTTDDSNPLYIRMGNPDLKPFYSQNLSAQYTMFHPKKRISVMAGLYYSNVQNSITNRTTYDEETGGRTSQPININGNWSSAAHLSLNIPLGPKHFSVSSNSSSNYREMPSYQLVNHETTKSMTKRTGLNQSLKFTYRNDELDIGLGSGLYYSKAENNLAEAKSVETQTYSINNTFQYTFPNSLSFSSDATMSIRKGFSGGLDGQNVVWNMQLAYSFLKQRQLTMTLQTFDFLHQQNTLIRNVNAFQSSDRTYDVVTAYWMLKLIYRFHVFGKRS